MNDFPDVEELMPKPLPVQNVVPEGMRMFTIYRHEDESGVSGTGVVIQGVLFADGKCTIQWLKGPDPGDVQTKQDFSKFLDTHVTSHPTNRSVLTWGNKEQLFFGPKEQQEEQ